MSKEKFLSGREPYIIAEIGGNHGGDLETAKAYVREAAETGCDAVKFQLYRAETLILENEPPLPLASEDHDTQFSRFKELELEEDEWDELVEHTREMGVDFTASVFDREMADFAANVSPFIKIASGDLTNLPLLRHVVSLDTPIVLSTGFASMDEIRTVVRELPSERLALLHCVSAYPTEEGNANLQMIGELAEEFDVPVGYSDHTVGTLATKAAVASGASIVEKHFTLDKSIEHGDHRLSANPEEMREIVRDASRIWNMFSGEGRDGPFEVELDIKEQMRRSLATKRSIEEGMEFRQENLITLRPERGISPFRVDEVIGKVAVRDISAREILTEDDLISPGFR